MEFISSSSAIGTLIIWNILIALGIPEHQLEIWLSQFSAGPLAELLSGGW
ncbi:hypothetical protein [Corynebacterium pacaense]|nr:hypothetical protein [Corynebacterium pacaense]